MDRMKARESGATEPEDQELEMAQDHEGAMLENEHRLAALKAKGK